MVAHIPLTDIRRPKYVEAVNPIYGKVVHICWQCAYGECLHCDDFNHCQHNHWWQHVKVSEKEASSARNTSSGVWETSEPGGQLDLFDTSGDLPQSA